MLGIQYNSVAVPDPLQRIGGGTTVTDAHPRALDAHNRAVLRIRNKSFGSGYGSGSGLQLVLNPIRIRILDWDPDQKLAKTSSFLLKFLRSLIFKHKKSVIPQLRDLATNNLRNKFSIYEDLSHIYVFCMCKVSLPYASESLAVP
jgi:hypothetical protein